MSPIQVQSIALPFAGGVETQQDAKQVPATRLIDLQNGVFSSVSAVSKRNGYRALARTVLDGGGEYVAAKALATRNDELLLLTATNAYSYRESQNHWVDTGAISGVVATETTIAKTGTEQSQCDSASSNGALVVAWVDSRGGVWSQTQDATSLAILRRATMVSPTVNCIRPRVVACGQYVHVYCVDPAANRIYISVVDTLSPRSIVAATVLVDDLAPAVDQYDACPTTAVGVLSGVAISPAPAMLAWATDANSVKIAYVTGAGRLASVLDDLPSPAAVLTGAAVTRVACRYSNGISHVMATSATAMFFAAFGSLNLSTSLQTNTPVTNPDGLAMTVAGIDVWICTESSAATDRDRTITIHKWDGSSLALVRVMRGVALATRGWTVNGLPYVYVTHDVPFFSVYLAIRLTDNTCVARTMPITAHGRDGWLSSVSVDSNTAMAPLLYNEQLEATAGQFAETGLRLVALNFAHADAYQTAQLGAGLYLAAANPQHYDGTTWREAGFHYAPDGEILISSGGVGGLSDGLYTYRFWYEETDATGEIHRGPVSIGTQTQGGNASAVTITGPMLRTTGRQNVRIIVARSESNDATTFYRVTSPNPSMLVGDNAYLANNATVDTWTFTDVMTDATLITNEPSYVNGGVLSNDPCGMRGSVVARGKNRLFWTDPSDPNLIRFSQEIADGYALESPALLSFRVDPYGGPIVGLAMLDDALVIFRETATYVVGGPGPLAAPLLNPEYAFTPAALITSDVGSSAARSIVQIPDGIMFNTPKGLYTLGRDRQVRFTGSPVDAYNGQTVSRATLLASDSRVNILTAAGRTLTYDYSVGQWSTFTNHEGGDGIVWRGIYCYLRNDGRVFVETKGSYADDNSHIPLVLETAWIHMPNYLQGWQRILYASFLGNYKSPHTIRVRFALDYEQSWSPPYNCAVDSNNTGTAYGTRAYGAGPYGGSGSTVYQRRIHLNQRCQAIRFRLEDIEQTNDYGAAFEISELMLTGGILRNRAFKLPATRSS